MRQTVKAERWVVARCEECGKRRIKPEGRPCGWCESGEERPRGRTLQGRAHLLGLARELEKADATVGDLAHEIGVPEYRLRNYADATWSAPEELAETLALYLDTTVEELTKP